MDKGGRHGAATPFAVAALPCLFVGVIGLAPDLEAAGTGLLMVAIGLALAYNGASVWRRATTWIGGAVAALGLGIFLADMAGDDATIGGMLFIAGGIGLVFVGHLIANAINEPDEMTVTFGVAAVPAGPMRRVTPLVAGSDAPPAPAPDEAEWAPPPPPTRPRRPPDPAPTPGVDVVHPPQPVALAQRQRVPRPQADRRWRLPPQPVALAQRQRVPRPQCWQG